MSKRAYYRRPEFGTEKYMYDLQKATDAIGSDMDRVFQYIAQLEGRIGQLEQASLGSDPVADGYLEALQKRKALSEPVAVGR